MEYSVDELARRLRTLEFEISDWGSRNSQSNPGAVMELRDMRKQRNALENLLIEAIARQKAKDKEEVESAKKSD
jgi:hypothetical protein